MTFKTSLAPEPIWPPDPDWAGPDRAEPNWASSTVEGYPVELSWCEVEEAVSYIIQAYKWSAPYCPEILCPYCPNCPMLFHKEGKAVPQDFLTFYFDLDSFTKETLYDWEIATCFDEYGKDCGDFGQRWRFFGNIMLTKVELWFPEDGSFTNLSSRLEWKHVGGANSYIYEINPVPALQNRLATSSVSFKDIWGYLTLDTAYSWRVKPCWDDGGNDCQEENWSDEWEFTTTGARPTKLQTDAVIIPVKLDWEDVPGALSYYYEVVDASNNIAATGTLHFLTGTLPSEVLIDYPALRQDRNYSWRVKTCADEKGEVCGNWSDTKNFKTFKLEKPTEPYPSDGSDFYTYERYLKWKEVPGARAYQYEVFEGVKTVPLTKVPANSAYVDTPRELGVGEHAWRVKACLDENCQETGEFSNDWHFNVVEAEHPSGEAGLVPCGRDVNPPDPYGIDETERCGFQHIFLLLRNILDLALWRIGLIILVLLALASGIIFYFSGYLSEQFGVSDPILKVKSLWKAAGIGYLIIFSAYTLINIFLALFGYKVGVFGPWWVIKF